MADRVVSIDKMADVIVEELMKYDQRVTEGVKEEVKRVSKECAKDIKSGAPVDTGKYKRSWRSKIVFENREDIRCLVYAGPSGYRLAHLLEHGHAKVNGGRVEGRPHIRPAADKAEQALLGKIKIIVKG